MEKERRSEKGGGRHPVEVEWGMENILLMTIRIQFHFI